MKKIVIGIGVLLGLLLAYFLFYPVPFEPVAYTAPPNPGFEGPFSPNDELDKTDLLLPDFGFAPEDVAIGLDSILYTGYADGRIVKFTAKGELIATLGNTEGRPLGLKLDNNGHLIIADEYKGLLSMDPIGNITLLTNEVAGEPLNFVDDLDISSDGIIYFSNASQRNHSPEIETEFWELQPTGSILSYHPESKETRLEVSGLRFANGISLGPDEEYLVFTETVGVSIQKYWIKGAKKGTLETFVDELPGYPDNIDYNDDGIFWVAMPSQRNPSFEGLFENPFWRKVIARIPRIFLGEIRPPRSGMIVGLDLNGKVVYNFQSPQAHIHDITSVNQLGTTLFLGNIGLNAVGRFQIKEYILPSEEDTIQENL